MVLLWWVADFVTHPRSSWHHCPRNKNNMNNQEHKALGVNPFPRFLWKCSLPAPVLDVRAADGSTQLVGEFPSENWRWSTMAIKPTASINPLLVLAMTCWKFLNWIQIRKLNASGRHWTSSSHPIKGKHMRIFALFGVQGSHEFVGSCRIPIFRVRSSSLKISKDFKDSASASRSFPADFPGHTLVPQPSLLRIRFPCWAQRLAERRADHGGRLGFVGPANSMEWLAMGSDRIRRAFCILHRFLGGTVHEYDIYTLVVIVIRSYKINASIIRQSRKDSFLDFSSRLPAIFLQRAWLLSWRIGNYL